jgi:hypothetical protein
MTSTLNLQDDWHHVATVELVGESNDLQVIIDATHAGCRVERSERSAAGCSWFDIRVNFGVGARQAAHAAYIALTALQKAADRNILYNYRVVSGRHWLELAEVLGLDSAPQDELHGAKSEPGAQNSTRRWS